jgi:amino acid transporter
MLDTEQGSIEMVSTGHNPPNEARSVPQRGLKAAIRTAASSALHSFDPHPESSNPNAELTLALDKSLQAYHSQLIALGSAIGTGVFITSGAGLATAGPIPLLCAFSFVGITLCPTVFALGEMATFLPYPGGFVMHSSMFLDEAWGAAMGWK